MSKLEDKTSVIGAKSKELSYLCDACRPWPFPNCLHFFRISTDSILTDCGQGISLAFETGGISCSWKLPLFHLLLKQVAFLG